MDTVNGGIGFRNHTAPVDTDLTSEWVEVILFISPHTFCVNLNITSDYQISVGFGYTEKVNFTLADRVGIVNLNRIFELLLAADEQSDSTVMRRAYEAGHLNNAWSMAHKYC